MFEEFHLKMMNAPILSDENNFMQTGASIINLDDPRLSFPDNQVLRLTASRMQTSQGYKFPKEPPEHLKHFKMTAG